MVGVTFQVLAIRRQRVITSLVQQASALSTASANLTAPADIIPGDYLVFFDFASGGVAPTIVIPSGFTQVGEANGTIGVSFGRCVFSHKIADGTEASAVLTGMNDSTMRKKLVTFRGNTIIASITPADFAGEVTSGNPASQTCNASGGVGPLIVIAGYECTNASVDPRTFNPNKDGEYSGVDQNMYVAWKIYTSSPSDHAIDMDDEGVGNALASYYVQIS